MTMVTRCTGCEKIFESSTIIYKTHKKQLRRAGWEDFTKEPTFEVSWHCPNCQTKSQEAEK